MKEQRGIRTEFPVAVCAQERTDVKERTGSRDSGMSIPKERDA